MTSIPSVVVTTISGPPHGDDGPDEQEAPDDEAGPDGQNRPDDQHRLDDDHDEPAVLHAAVPRMDTIVPVGEETLAERAIDAPIPEALSSPEFSAPCNRDR